MPGVAPDISGRLRITLVGVSLALAVGLFLVLAGSLHHPGDSPPRSAGVPVGPHGVWNGLEGRARGSRASNLAAEHRAFEVLRSHGEAIPIQTKSRIRSVVGATGKSFALEETQLVHTSEGNLWIVSGSNVVCLVEAAGGALACDPAGAFVKDGLTLGTVDPLDQASGRPGHFLVFGVAPDWAKRARLLVGSRSREVPIKGNIFALRSRNTILLQDLER